MIGSTHTSVRIDSSSYFINLYRSRHGGPPIASVGPSKPALVQEEPAPWPLKSSQLRQLTQQRAPARRRRAPWPTGCSPACCCNWLASIRTRRRRVRRGTPAKRPTTMPRTTRAPMHHRSTNAASRRRLPSIRRRRSSQLNRPHLLSRPSPPQRRPRRTSLRNRRSRRCGRCQPVRSSRPIRSCLKPRNPTPNLKGISLTQGTDRARQASAVYGPDQSRRDPSADHATRRQPAARACGQSQTSRVAAAGGAVAAERQHHPHAGATALGAKQHAQRQCGHTAAAAAAAAAAAGTARTAHDRPTAVGDAVPARRSAGRRTAAAVRRRRGSALGSGKGADSGRDHPAMPAKTRSRLQTPQRVPNGLLS